MTVDVFKNDDAGFVAWREANRDGYILNIGDAKVRDDREYYLPFVKLHRADCGTLSPNKNGEKTWTSTGYFKVCSDNWQDVESWVYAHVDSDPDWEIPRCASCGG